MFFFENLKLGHLKNVSVSCKKPGQVMCYKGIKWSHGNFKTKLRMKLNSSGN